MSEADASLCRSIIAHIKQAQRQLSLLELQFGPPRLEPGADGPYRIAWTRIRQILAQIPANWGSTSTASVANLLEYGTVDRPVGLTGPEKLAKMLECIAQALSVPRVFFSLESECLDFAKVAVFATSSSFIKPSDRMGFISFQGIIEQFAASLAEPAAEQSVSVMRQCGVLGSLIERYQDWIVRLYEKKLPVSELFADLDLLFDSVMKVVNAYPMYTELMNALSEALTGMNLLPLSRALSDPGTTSALAQFEDLLAQNERAQQEVMLAELALKNAVAAANADDGEFEAILARVRGTA
jgi:hypothetical protein